jgi:LacI family transcriptional regulator
MRGKKMEQKRPSIQDVALRAGVSISTVSRVISNSNYPVTPDVREKVLRAASDIEYSPNQSAQTLRQHSNRVIGLIVRAVHHGYFGEIAAGVTEKALEKGYLAFICNTGRNVKKEFEYHELLWQHRVKGIILTGGGVDSAAYIQLVQHQLNRMRQFGLRIVALAPQGLDMLSVSYDHVALGRTMTEYLLSKGHRRIAFISGPRNIFTSQYHVLGYREALTKWRLPFDENAVVFTRFDEVGGDEACRTMLSKGIVPTAICTGNDNIAIGVLHALTVAGLKVPEDVSIVGIGDLTLSNYVKPRITTFRIPRYKMGAKAVELVVQEQEISTDQHIHFEPELIERETVRER